MSRTLVILLVLRAVFAPVTVRATKSGHLFRARVVVSMRVGWPPQRLARFSSTSKLLKLFQGKHKDQGVDAGRWLARRDPWASSATLRGAWPIGNSLTPCLDRSAASPRC